MLKKKKDQRKRKIRNKFSENWPILILYWHFLQEKSSFMNFFPNELVCSLFLRVVRNCKILMNVPL